MNLKNLIANWKTTSAGLIMIVGSVVHLVFSVKNGTASEALVTTELTAVVAGLGLLFSGDASKSASKEELQQVVQDTAKAIDTGNTIHLTKTVADAPTIPKP